jgi:glycosyltransferase involved in cell wall biosynthesis
VYQFIRVAASAKTPSVMFLIAGDGELRPQVENLLRQGNVADRVRLLGHVEDVDRLYGVADIVVLCSRAEGQPYALLEAMQQGCAVVATRVPGNQNLICDGQTGVLVSGDDESVVGAIDRLLADPMLRKRLGDNARAYVMQHHDPGLQVSKLSDVYAQTNAFCICKNTGSTARNADIVDLL